MYDGSGDETSAQGASIAHAPSRRDAPARIAFLMDQVAGHITNSRNLRRIADDEPGIDAVWWEIHSLRPAGRLERYQQRFLPFLPHYVTGNGRAALETRRALRALPYDAVLTNVRVGVLFARRFARVPTMIDFDVTPRQLDELPGYSRGLELPGLERLKFRLAARMFRSAALLQAWSEWAKQGVVEGYAIDPAKVIVNPPGVDLDFWGRAMERPPHTGPVRVLFVGGDFERKGGPSLLRWFGRQDPGRVALDIVTRDDIAEAPGMRVHRTLGPNSPELLALYRDADVFVLPSVGECFGIATVEAMAAGLPVIASLVGGAGDIVDDGANGFLVPPGDEAALAVALDKLVGDADLRARFGARSRQLAQERFDLCANGRRTLAELARLADEHRSGR